MCGISGIIYKQLIDNNKNDIIKMTDIIAHRGPDGSGFYNFENISLGHRRLSIIDLSDLGLQPMNYIDRYMIVFNGEIYNYIELKDELSSMGYKFTTGTDTEVIMASYDRWGQDCQNRFNGMWAFILLDRIDKTVFCSRDRFGVKPLYYTEINDNLLIASEIKQFTSFGGWKAVANRERLIDSLFYDGIHDHTNETLFKNVYQLRGGECMLINLSSGQKVIKRWYDLSRKKIKGKYSLTQSVDEFGNLFNDSIKLRLRSDVKVGSCLSGGLDSSSIVVTVNKLLHSQGKEKMQETVSAIFKDRDIDESRYVDLVVAQTHSISHTVTPTSEELLRDLDKLIWHQDEPFGSTSIFAQWTVYKEAKKNDLTVMLDGQGSDEYLCGYNSFNRVYFRELLKSAHFIKLYKYIKTFRTKYKSYYVSPYKDLVETLVRTVFTNLVIDSFKNKLKSNEKFDYKYHMLSKLRKNPHRIVNRLQWSSTLKSESINQMIYTSLPKLLHHQDRNSMAHSIESREPFLDYRLVELVLSLPSEYKLKNNVSKYILRAQMNDKISSEIVNRLDKLGFASPQQRWIKEKKEVFRSMLDDSCNYLSEFIDKKLVMEAYDYQTNYMTRIDGFFWNIVCTSRWLQIFNVSI